MAKPNPRCVRCNQRMRNDGTADAPQWVCNNPKCVRYVPLIVDENGYIGESIEEDKKDGQE